MRSAAIFAVFGFIAALVQALGQEQPLEETIRSGFGWALGFGLLGWGIGRVARSIAREALPGPRDPSEGNAVGEGALPTDQGNVERAWVRPALRNSEDDTPTSAGGAGSRDRPQDAQKV